jgi:choline dehydrogenase-like flavoprotein
MTMPKGIGKAMARPSSTIPYQTEAQSDTGGQPEYWTRGKGIGGSSAVNGMMYVRGQPSDYVELSTIAGPDWSWDRMVAAYRALEDHTLGASSTRGAGGALRVSMPGQRLPVCDAFIAAGSAMGLSVSEDMNEPDERGTIGYAPCTVRDGRRETAATAFLDPIRSRPNLRIETGVTVDRVLFDENRSAVGITGERAGAPVTFCARREVLLAAGALATPAILMRSGVGPGDPLAALGIPLISDSPFLGTNLREHRALIMQWRVPDPLSVNREHRGLRLAANVARYYLRGNGIMTAATYDLLAYFRTAPDVDRPDAQLLIAPYSLDFTSPTLDLEPRGGVQVCAYILRPESAGTMSLRSRDPHDLPIIRPDYHGEAADRRKMIDVVRFLRKMVRQGALAPIIGEEIRPGPADESDDDILAAYDRLGNGAYHASGTCRMGAGNDTVVDPALRVRGVDRLRVIDTSIQPFLLAGNTQAPAMAMAWRAADLIQATS